MFQEFENQVWTPSSAAVTVTVNTDYSVDGVSSRKVVWDTGADETCTIVFDSVALGSYEEISLYINQKDLLATGNTFTITVDGTLYTFGRLKRKGWNHILIDCQSMGAVTTIVFTSLVDDLTLFIDYMGYRRVTHDRDLDVIQAIQSAISLDYDVATTLTADAAAGAVSISLASSQYVNNTSVLRLDDGGGTTEDVYLSNQSGDLKTALTSAFSSGDTVSILCPVLLENYDDVEPDPICGIVLYDKATDKRTVEIEAKGVIKKKRFTGEVGILVYIDCSSKKKLLQLVREYDNSYGERFEILLDGEKVDLILDRSQFVDDIIGNNPRMSYFYEIDPQPYFIANGVALTTLTLTMESQDPDLVYDTEVSA